MAVYPDEPDAVTPPRENAERPVVVTVAVVLWIVLGVVMVGIAGLYAVALIAGAAETVGLLVMVMVALAAAGVAVVVAARRLGRGSRPARRALSVVGGVLAVLGLVQVTFTGAAGAWFVAFVAGAVLLHVPTARAWFAGEGS